MSYFGTCKQVWFLDIILHRQKASSTGGLAIFGPFLFNAGGPNRQKTNGGILHKRHIGPKKGGPVPPFAFLGHGLTFMAIFFFFLFCHVCCSFSIFGIKTLLLHRRWGRGPTCAKKNLSMGI